MDAASRNAEHALFTWMEFQSDHVPFLFQL
jgi:hypothetical protein